MIVSVLQVTWVSEKNRIRKVMFLKAPKLEHLDNVRNRCWDQNLAGIPEMGTSNVLGRTQSKMGYNAKMQSRVWERQRAGRAHLMEQMSKKNSRAVGCQKWGKRGKASSLWSSSTTSVQTSSSQTTLWKGANHLLLCVPISAHVSSTY